MISHCPSLGLMYFDGDIDLNTAPDRLQEYLTEWLCRHITGDGADARTHMALDIRSFPQENIVLFGYNSEAGWMDAAEVQRLD